MDIGGHEEQLPLAIKFPKAKLALLKRTWLESAQRQFQLNGNKETTKYTEPSLRGEVYLAVFDWKKNSSLL